MIIDAAVLVMNGVTSIRYDVIRKLYGDSLVWSTSSVIFMIKITYDPTLYCTNFFTSKSLSSRGTHSNEPYLSWFCSIVNYSTPHIMIAACIMIIDPNCAWLIANIIPAYPVHRVQLCTLYFEACRNEAILLSTFTMCFTQISTRESAVFDAIRLWI